MIWADLIAGLEAAPWEGPRGAARTHVTGLLRQLAPAARETISRRVEQIAADPNLLAETINYSEYPRVPMDKFSIYVDQQDRFRIRLHRHKAKDRNGLVVDRPHGHKWDAATLVLGGGYINTVYRLDDLDEEGGRARLAEGSSVELRTGDVEWFDAFTPHTAINPAETEPCLTLFVRGPSLAASARIFDPDTGTFFETHSADEQFAQSLRRMGELDGHFH